MGNDNFRNDPVAREAEQALYGENLQWLRSQAARRGLVIASVLAIVASTGARMADWPVIGLISILAFLATWVGLRIAVRKIVDLPDRYIDERMRARRGEAYRHAYTAIGVLLSAVMIAHIALSLLAKYRGWPAMTADTWFELAFSLIFSLMVLPNAIYAWNERDI